MGFFAVRSILRISLYAASAAVTVAACTHAAEPTGQLIPPAQLNALVAGRTLRVRATSDTPFETLLFLGSGRKAWLDNQVIPGKDPQPGDMSMVLDWRVEAGSRVCSWARPLIGEMPSFTPPFREACKCFVPGRRRKVSAPSLSGAGGPRELCWNLGDGALRRRSGLTVRLPRHRFGR
jgi:hypothetical protein